MPKSLFAGLAVATCLAGPSFSADILGACSNDIAEYCSAVEPGHGRIAACLHAHETTLSEACDAATADMADILDTTFEAIRFALQECSGDIATHCSGIPAGEGRILSCLAEQGSAVSDGCASVINQVALPTVSN